MDCKPNQYEWVLRGEANDMRPIDEDTILELSEEYVDMTWEHVRTFLHYDGGFGCDNHFPSIIRSIMFESLHGYTGVE